MTRGEIQRRFDPTNHRPEIREKVLRLEAQETVTLGKLTKLCYRYPTFYGFDYQPSGVLVLKGENISRDGEILESDEPSYISEDVHARFPRTQLEADDLIVSVRGEVGKVGLVPMRLENSNINANTIRISLDEKSKDYFLPRFIWLFLNSELGQLLIKQFIAGGVQETITAPELLQVKIPKISPSIQNDLVSAMDKARTTRWGNLAQADALLTGLDVYLLETLGLCLPPEDERRVYAVKRNQVPRRFDPHFHGPNFIQIVRMLQASGAVPLGTVAGFSSETWKPEPEVEKTFRYIEISGVSPKEGVAIAEEVPTVEAPSRARMVTRNGDIIVSLTRPHHGSIAQITADLDGCIASTGFSVIRDVVASVRRDYLWCVLRSRLSLQQMLQRASGGNYPAITESELSNILIPIPKQAIQEQIAAEVRLRREAARALRAEAEAGWKAAKAWFEAQLLGNVPEQMAVSVCPEMASAATEPTRRYEPLPRFKAATGLQNRAHDGASRHISDDAPLYPLAAETPAVSTQGGQAALPAANQPVPGGIPARLLTAMQPGRACSRAELLAATGISETDWSWAIRQLREEGLVVQVGEKRGTRYRRK